jgi:hypothetical protein
LILALSPEPSALSQIPQGFNYQAIARDGSGNPIANATIKVELSILTDTTGFFATGGGIYLWEEEHTNVKTNAFGLFTVVFGNPTATKVQGTASSFSAIDWANTPLYIGTKIANPSTYKNLGTAKLWSVPYSLVSDSAKSLLKGSRLSVVSSNDGTTDALFEVKRKDGQTVFAVYPNAVNIYVPRTTPKGVKGGFAIGGFDGSKTDPQDYFRVTPDSVRIYIDKTPNLLKGATKGGFAIGGFDQLKGWQHDLLTVSKDSVRIYIDKTPKVVKGTTKGGFAIGGFDEGKVNPQDLLTVSNDSIRMYINDISGKGTTKGGFAIGGFSEGKGGKSNFLNIATDETGVIKPAVHRIVWYPIKNAFIAGRVRIGSPDSVGENSFATGYESKASGKYSQAMGFKAVALGDYSTAIGKNAIANNVSSFSFGEDAKAKNEESYAFGRGATAEGFRSFAFGSAGIDSLGQPTGVAYAKGDYAFAIGRGSQALGKGAFAVGILDSAKGDNSFAFGYKTRATGSFGSTAIGGYGTTASGTWSTSIGFSDMAIGDYSTAVGCLSISIAKGSIAMGYASIAFGEYANAMGNHTTAFGSASTSMGNNTSASSSSATAMGQWTTAGGIVSTAMGNFSTANGLVSTAMGDYTTAPSAYETVIGRYNTLYTPLSANDWNASDKLFVIGNGTDGTHRSNALTVMKNGNVGIGTTDSPSEKLDIDGNARFRAVASGSYDSPLNITIDGTLTRSTSDVSMKKNIMPITEALQKVLEMKGVYFSWKTDMFNNRRVGFIAQDMEKVLPEVVFTNPVDKLKGINYNEITVVLAEAVKEQQKIIDSQKTEILSLKERIDQIEAALAKGGIK